MAKIFYIIGDSHSRSFSHNNNFIPLFLGQGKEFNFTSDHCFTNVLNSTKKLVKKLDEENCNGFIFNLGEPDARFYLGLGWYPWKEVSEPTINYDELEIKIIESIARYESFLKRIRDESTLPFFVLNIVPSNRSAQNKIVDLLNNRLEEMVNRVENTRFISINEFIYFNDNRDAIKDEYVSDHVHLNNRVQVLVENYLLNLGFDLKHDSNENLIWDNKHIQEEFIFNKEFGCYIMKNEKEGITQLDITVSQEDLTIERVLIKLEEFGICVIPSFVKDEILNALHVEYNEILNQKEESEAIKHLEYSIGEGKIFLPLKVKDNNFSYSRSLFRNPLFENIASKYLKSKNFILNKEIFVVKDVVGSKHHANDLHFDVIPTFKFFIYLTETTAENGAFACVPGSHKIAADIRKKHGNEISYENRYLSRELPFKESDAIPIEGKAGTLIIFDTDVFHRAGTVSKGERLVMRGHTRPVVETNKKPINFIGKLKSKVKRFFS